MNKEIIARRCLETYKRLMIIRKFAEQMGYGINESDYTHCFNNRPCHSIELLGTCDSEGDPYSWAWYTDTWEEF